MEISSFPGSFGDNSTPKDMTYTHIVGKQVFFKLFQKKNSNMEMDGYPFPKSRGKSAFLNVSAPEKKNLKI